jgi:hypothetical protein
MVDGLQLTVYVPRKEKKWTADREPAVLSGQQGSNSPELSSELQDGQQWRGWRRGPKRGRGDPDRAAPGLALHGCAQPGQRLGAVGVGCDVEHV